MGRARLAQSAEPAEPRAYGIHKKLESLTPLGGKIARPSPRKRGEGDLRLRAAARRSISARRGKTSLGGTGLLKR